MVFVVFIAIELHFLRFIIPIKTEHAAFRILSDPFYLITVPFCWWSKLSPIALLTFMEWKNFLKCNTVFLTETADQILDVSRISLLLPAQVALNRESYAEVDASQIQSLRRIVEFSQ